MKKVYCFFIRLEKLIDYELIEFFDSCYDPIYIGDERVNLYAFTEKKKEYNDFIETRNMEKFYTKIIRFEKESYKKFLNDNSEFRLSYNEYICRTNKKPYVDYFKFLTTESEYDIYTSNLEYIDNALNDLQYYTNSLFYTLVSLDNNVQDKIGYDIYLDIIDSVRQVSNGEYVSLELDGLQFILRQFGELFIGG